MWSQVQADLEKLLSERIYPILFSDRVYRSFLQSAGIGPHLPSKLEKLKPVERENLGKAAKIRAYIIAGELSRSTALDERSAGAKLLTGPVTLYRFWDSKAEHKRVGVWWFSKEVLEVCKQQAGRSADERAQWLREKLAVSLDWSDMDRLDTLHLDGADEIPAVVAIGARMRAYSPSALYEGRAPSRDYWSNLDRYFPGGVQQTVLPFIPEDNVRGEDLRRFLSSRL